MEYRLDYSSFRKNFETSYGTCKEILMYFSEINIRNNFKDSLLPFVTLEWSIDHSHLSLFNFRVKILKINFSKIFPF